MVHYLCGTAKSVAYSSSRSLVTRVTSKMDTKDLCRFAQWNQSHFVVAFELTHMKYHEMPILQKDFNLYTYSRQFLLSPVFWDSQI